MIVTSNIDRMIKILLISDLCWHLCFVYNVYHMDKFGFKEMSRVVKAHSSRIPSKKWTKASKDENKRIDPSVDLQYHFK